MPGFAEVLEAARTLTPTERLRLVDALWNDIAPSDWPLPSAEWIAEAQRRSQEHDQGRETAKPWAEVLDRARKQTGLNALPGDRSRR